MIQLASIAIGVSAIAALAALICRIDAMTWRTTSGPVIGMHLGLAIACIWAIGETFEHRLTPGAAGAVIASLCWLWVSYPTWAKGPPAHAER